MFACVRLGARSLGLAGQEIADYGARLAGMGVTEGHFYTDNGKIPVANLSAIKSL